MLVQVEALDAFVTILPDGDMVSAIRGEKVLLPKAVADKLVRGNLARPVAVKEAPENKAVGSAPTVKAPRKRAAAKKAATA